MSPEWHGLNSLSPRAWLAIGAVVWLGLVGILLKLLSERRRMGQTPDGLWQTVIVVVLLGVAIVGGWGAL